MPKPQYVYVAYIAATPERVWETMTAPAFAKAFFTCEMPAEWKVGARMESRLPDGSPLCEVEILECDPPRRLSLTWLKSRIEGVYRDAPRCVATVVLEPLGDVVRLTASETHEEPVDESYLEGAAEGWPVAVSRLKTLVETGKPLPSLRKTA